MTAMLDDENWFGGAWEVEYTKLNRGAR